MIGLTTPPPARSYSYQRRYTLRMQQLGMFGQAPAPRQPQPRVLPRLPPDVLTTIADPLALNPEQLAVVRAPLGPLLVIAGAGSGKTKVLVRRTAWLIASGIHPHQILLITFTRKAAQQMLSRVQEITPLPRYKVHGGTFHSQAATWLKTHGAAIGVSPRFTILDEAESASLLHLLASKQRLTGIKGFPSKRTLQSIYGHAANSMTPIEKTIEQHFPHYGAYTTPIETLHRLFRDTKWAQQRFDYDDLLLLVHRMLTEHPHNAAGLAHRYRAILVDEYQDTTRLQAELVRHLGAAHQNILVVGDDAQCLKEGTPVLTPEGYRPVERLQVGDMVLSGSGCGQIAPCRITQTSFSYPRDFIRITTSKGHTVDVSPQHVCFAKMNTIKPCWYVYLMYREGLGYRIGITSITKRYRNSYLRSTREHADKLWFLKPCQSRYEAQCYETLWSLRYQIPQTLYAPECLTKSGRMTNTQSKALFQEFGSNGYRLLKDFGLEFENPTYAPKASRSRNRIAINVIQCHSTGRMKRDQQPKHLLVAESRLGCHVAAQFPNCTVKGHYWRLRMQSSDYRSLLVLAQQLQSALRRAHYNAIVIEKANFLKGPQANTSLFLPIQAAGLLLGMTVPVLEDGAIITDTITSLDRLPNDDAVRFYDLEVEGAHNVITNGLITHNSIYAFRSADVRNMQEFAFHFPTVTVHTLIRNYRSSTPIVHLANKVIEGAPHLHPKTLLAQRDSQHRPQLIQCPDEPTQSAYVIQQIRDMQQHGLGLHRIAILFRSSAHSYDLETALSRHRLPFMKYGGLVLTETAHVKDFIAYLTVACRPTDRTSWQRLLLLIDRIGPATAEQLITTIKQAPRPLDVLRRDTSAAQHDLHQLAHVLTQLNDEAIPLSLRLQAVLDHYAIPLKRHYPDDMRERQAELAFLLRGYQDLPSLTDVLEAIHNSGHSTRSDAVQHPSDTLVLSTIHSAKGLEWDAVLIINVADGQLPHNRSFKDPSAIEEERRLLYVAITRPRYRLWLLYPSLSVSSPGLQSHTRVSRFLQPLDDGLFDHVQLT